MTFLCCEGLLGSLIYIVNCGE